LLSLTSSASTEDLGARGAAPHGGGADAQPPLGAVQHLVLVSPAGLTTQSPPGSSSLLWGCMYALFSPQRIARSTGRAGYAVFRTLYLAFTSEDKRMPDLYYQLAAATGCAGAGQGDVLVSRLMTLRFVAAPEGGLGGGGGGGSDFGSGGRVQRLASWWRTPVLGLLVELASGPRAPPVSVVWGDCDEVLPFSDWVPLLRIALPRAVVYKISNALHNPAHSDAEAVCAALIDCLRRGAEGGSQATTPREAGPSSVKACLGDVGCGPGGASGGGAGGGSSACGGVAGAGAGAGLFCCVGCGTAVEQRHSYFQCACSRFGYASFGLDGAADRRQWAAFGAFLSEGSAGTFNARTSASVVMRL
jgi:hypothetical protein